MLCSPACRLTSTTRKQCCRYDLYAWYLQILPSHRGIGIQLRDGGSARNITFANITLTAQRNCPTWWGAGEALAITVFPRYDNQATHSQLEAVTLQHIRATSESGIVIAGDEASPKRAWRIGNVSILDMQLHMRKLSAYRGGSIDLRPGLGTRHYNVSVPAVFVRNVERLQLQVCCHMIQVKAVHATGQRHSVAKCCTAHNACTSFMPARLNVQRQSLNYWVAPTRPRFAAGRVAYPTIRQTAARGLGRST